jgi:acetyl-CoA carboxylase biotin carboxyl carrier protein
MMAAPRQQRRGLPGRRSRMEVRAPMVGKIIEIAVETGAAVEADDDLVVIESMKMEIPVGAPGGGSVASIHVSVGDIVQEGDLLVILT